MKQLTDQRQCINLPIAVLLYPLQQQQQQQHLFQ